MSTLTCPKCQGDMRSYERNGVTVDQCGDCRGIFLDRGELEHLVEADSRAHASQPPAAPPAPQRDRRDDGGDDYGDRYRDDRYGSSSGHPRKKKKESWLENLFD